MIAAFLLPGTDGGVAVQLIATLLVGPTAIVMLAKRNHSDLAWLATGVLVLWMGFMGFRALH